MTAVGVVSIGVGVLALCGRLATIVAPAANLRGFKRLIRTNGRMRVVGVVAVTLGATMVWAGASEESTLASVLSVVGWAIVVAGTLAGVVFPSAYRALVNKTLPSDASASLTLLRIRGLLGIIASVLLIYFGARAL